VTTTRLEHNVRLRGHGTTNQIDVPWELKAADGSPRRILIECRHHGRRLKQKDVFAFDGVVRDLNSPELPTTGVMVTTTGSQSGAQSVANTYGVIILLLPEPTSNDLAKSAHQDRRDRHSSGADHRRYGRDRRGGLHQPAARPNLGV
jgi:hypothetical protein